MLIGKTFREIENIFEIESPMWWDLFNRVIPPEIIDAVLTETGTREKRKRKLSAKTTLMLAIAISIFTEESIEQVFSAMIEGIRFSHPDILKKRSKRAPFVMLDIALVQRLL